MKNQMWLFAKLSVVPVFSQFLATLLFSDYFPPISRVVNSVYLPDKEPPTPPRPEMVDLKALQGSAVRSLCGQKLFLEERQLV